MKTYAHFLVNGVEQIGSDAWFQLDGRNNLSNHVHAAKERMLRLKRVRPDFNGFQIRRGSKPSISVVIHQETFHPWRVVHDN